MRKRFRLSCLLAASTCLTTGTASAVDFTIGAGQTVNTTQTLTNNETGTVEAGGALIVTPGDAIFGNDGNTITNAGTVAGGDEGIQVNNGNTITNLGTVTGGLRGIQSNASNIITNSGTVTGTQAGILSGFASTIINSGTVTATNTGTAFGAIAVVSRNTVINSGTVTGDKIGMLIGADNFVSNSGMITGGQVGILSNSYNTIINSGTVIGGTNAVEFERFEHTTLRLLAGSALQGNLALGGEIPVGVDKGNTLEIGPGLNTALGFTGDPIIQTNGLPFIVVGDTVYVVDVTGFSVQDEMLSDLTRAVSGSLEDRLSAVRWSDQDSNPGSIALGYAQVPHAMEDPADDPYSGFWASGFGGYRTQDGGTTTLDFEARFAGALGGYDAMVGPETRLGIFGGLSFADIDTGVVGQDLSTSSFFGGLYLGHEFGHYVIDASVTAGWTGFDSERRIANNMVVGGIERARASYDGAFISPSLTLGTDLAVGLGTLTPSVSVRYAVLFLDNYTETGSAANLTVGDRAIHILEAGAELAYALAPFDTGIGSLQQSFSVGVDGTIVDGDAVSATIVGQALSFSAETENTARGFLGYDAAFAVTEGADLSLSAEAAYASNDALTLDGRAGFRVAF